MRHLLIVVVAVVVVSQLIAADTGERVSLGVNLRMALAYQTLENVIFVRKYLWCYC